MQTKNDIIKDNQATLINARKFLDKDYWKLEQAIKGAYGVHSVDISETKVDTSISPDSKERSYLSAIDADNIIKSAKEAMAYLPDEHRKLIFYSYFKHRNKKWLATVLNMSDRNILIHKNLALIEFAKYFDMRQMVNGVHKPFKLTETEV